MGALCFSLAPILRCAALSTLQSILILIPPALILFFSFSLIVIRWGDGSRIHFVLAAEGLLYFLIALADFLSHFLPFINSSHFRFKVFDIAIGAASGLTLFLYTLFLFLFIRTEVVPDLPNRFQRIASSLLLFFMPVILASNALGSFLGVSYRTIPPASGQTRSTVALGFISNTAQTEFTFFSALTLGVLTTFQALSFVLSFYRLLKAFIFQKRIETEKNADNETYLFRGIGWIAAGIKLGAIETVIGFVNEGFGIVITRRVLRSFGRACLIIGVAKGVDTLESFTMLKASDLKSRIGLPDAKTFQHVGADDVGVQDRDVYRKSILDYRERMRNSVFNPLGPRPVSIVVGGPSPFADPPTAPTSARLLPPPIPPEPPWYNKHSVRPSLTSTYSVGSRVTVAFMAGGGPPTLDVRLSALDLPSPKEFVASVKEKAVWELQREAELRARGPHPYANPDLLRRQSLSTYESSGSATPRQRLKRSNTVASEPTRARSGTVPSMQSYASSSTMNLGELTAQFPPLPSRVIWRGSQGGAGLVTVRDGVYRARSRTSSVYSDRDQQPALGLDVSPFDDTAAEPSNTQSPSEYAPTYRSQASTLYNPPSQLVSPDVAYGAERLLPQASSISLAERAAVRSGGSLYLNSPASVPTALQQRLDAYRIAVRSGESTPRTPATGFTTGEPSGEAQAEPGTPLAESEPTTPTPQQMRERIAKNISRFSVDDGPLLSPALTNDRYMEEEQEEDVGGIDEDERRGVSPMSDFIPAPPRPAFLQREVRPRTPPSAPTSAVGSTAEDDFAATPPRPAFMRVTSVGHAPMRATPPPTPPHPLSRASIPIDSLEFEMVSPTDDPSRRSNVQQTLPHSAFSSGGFEFRRSTRQSRNDIV